MNIPKRKFGKSGFEVSAIGLGAGQIGDAFLNEKDVEKLLNSLLENGINLIDTARAYGLSEERIGKFLSHKRKDFIISTKVGYGISGFQDWTYDCILAGVDYACRLLKTDYIDIVHLHTCPINILLNGEVISALENCKEKGKIRAIAYSGENEELEYAVSCGRFDSIQCSVNIADQINVNTKIKSATDKNMGVLAKRSIANAPWRFNEQPFGNYCETYWLRLKKMNLQTELNIKELAIRFTAFSEGISSALIGTTKIENLIENLDYVQKGPLPEEIYNYIRNTFNQFPEFGRSEI